MRGMKITVDAAMRARDVSRPRAEHEALARENENETAAGSSRTEPPGPASSPDARPVGAAADATTPAGASDGPSKARRPHRRRKRR
jgi:hypothetical protein